MLYEHAFKTPPYSSEEVKKQIEEQNKNDLIFNENMKKLLEKYPWYYKFPIITSEYTIVYDYDKEQFRVRIKLPASAPEAQRQDLITKALEEFKKVNVTVTPTSYYILYQN